MAFLATLGLNQRARFRVLVSLVIGAVLLAVSVLWNVVTGAGRFADVGGLAYQSEGGALVDGWYGGPVLMVGAGRGHIRCVCIVTDACPPGISGFQNSIELRSP